MAKIFDIALDSEFDLLIEGGDFVAVESTRQHQQCLLLAEPGEYKHNPVMGVGAYSYLNDDETLEDFKKAIQKTFEADGMGIEHLVVNANGNIDVTATYP